MSWLETTVAARSAPRTRGRGSPKRESHRFKESTIRKTTASAARLNGVSSRQAHDTSVLG